jgi:hypothetical protein
MEVIKWKQVMNWFERKGRNLIDQVKWLQGLTSGYIQHTWELL